MYINNPMEIEEKSMEIIQNSFKNVDFTDQELTVAKRIIHTTGDVSYSEIIKFQNDFIKNSLEALKSGGKIYTDTNMTKAGINKKSLEKLGLEVVCYVSDEDVFKLAKKNNTTRSQAAIEKAINEGIKIFSVGNAPTALFKLLEEVDKDKVDPDFIIGVPVGFVGAAESKEELRKYSIPQITTVGNKGGSNVAASIINSLMYMLVKRWKS